MDIAYGGVAYRSMGAEGLGEPARKRQRAGTVKWSDSRRVVADRRGE